MYDSVEQATPSFSFNCRSLKINRFGIGLNIYYDFKSTQCLASLPTHPRIYIVQGELNTGRDFIQAFIM